MSSPLSSLGKHRRIPLQLQSPGKRTVSFKLSAHNEDEAMLLNDILSPRTQIPAQAVSPSCSKGMATKASTQGAAPTDMELMSSMMQKIALLEQKVKSQAQELQLKTRKVAELEKQVKALQKGKDSPESSRTEELEVMCRQLQSQVWEMEQFLNDYGLIWVGERHEQLEELKSLTKQENQSSRSLWKPGNATVPEYRIDLDLILENLKELNVLAGEGVSRIEHTAGGARLRQPEAVSLTLYQNGIVMFNGPFRAYAEPSTQQCLQDLMDGYFPSELQARYPEGVPFQVTDRRDVFFRDRQLSENFPGQGQVVGHSRSSEVKETSEIPGPKLSLEQFLNKLPKSLVRKGHVIDIRGPIKETLQGSAGTCSNEVILVETPSLGALKERLKAGKQDPSPAANISTLRIKSESGEQTYIVTMLFTETIRDLRQHLVQARGGDGRPYEILSTFPQRVYADSSMTLQQCGLVPNASLLLREQRPSATARRPAADERLGTSHQAGCCPPTQPLSAGALCTGKGEVQPRPY